MEHTSELSNPGEQISCCICECDSPLTLLTMACKYTESQTDPATLQLPQSRAVLMSWMPLLLKDRSTISIKSQGFQIHLEL